MAVKLKRFSSTTAAALSSTSCFGTSRQAAQFLEVANAPQANGSPSSGVVFLGPSTVTSAGLNATKALAPGQTFTLPIGGGWAGFLVDLSSLYVVCSDGTTFADLTLVTADGRRIPTQI